MSQSERLKTLLDDGKAHRTDEIMRHVYGNEHVGLARVGARIYDLKKRYHLNIKGWRDEDRPALYWYQIIKDTPQTPSELFPQPPKVELKPWWTT